MEPATQRTIPRTTGRSIKIYIMTGILILLATFYVLMSFEKVQPGYAGVVYKPNGGISGTILPQGWHFISPIDKVTQYPISREIVAFSSKNDEGKEGDTSIRVGSKEGKIINVDASLTIHCDAAKLATLFTQFKGVEFGALSEGIVKQVVKARLNEVTKQYATFDVYSIKTAEISALTEKSIGEELGKYGLVVDNFEITDVVLDAETLVAIDNLQKAVMAQKQVEAVALSEQKKAEAEVKVAEANALKLVAEAKGESQRKSEEARGNADALMIKAQSEANSNKLIAQSLTPEVLELKKLEIEASVKKAYYEAWSKGGSLVPTTIMGTTPNLLYPMPQK